LLFVESAVIMLNNRLPLGRMERDGGHLNRKLDRWSRVYITLTSLPTVVDTHSVVRDSR